MSNPFELVQGPEPIRRLPLEVETLIARDPERALATKKTRRKKTKRKKSRKAEAPVPLPHGVRPLTDLGNAERLVDQYGTQIRYVGVRKRWLIWDGRRWTHDDTNTIAHYAKQTVRTIADEAPGHAACRAWAQRSESSERIAAMVRLAASDPTVAISPDKLDADDWLFTSYNGTIDLRTGDLLPHDPDNLCTKMTSVKYDPAATCPTWMAFLESIFEGNQDTIRFMQKAAGYSATASVREQVMFVLLGGGSNGKSTFLEMLRTVLGDFSQQLPPETLMERRGPDGGPSNDVARLRGARFAGAVETSENRKLAEARVKQLTGGDTVVARFLHAEFEEFRPVAKVWLATNHRPKVSGADEGIWRRLRLVMFNRRFGDDEKDLDLSAKLQAELPGILAWVIQGTQMWLREGLGTPDVIKAATADYRNEQDTIGQFLDEETVSDPNFKVSAGLLYAAYKAWALSNGEYVVSQKMLGMRLTDRGLHRDKHGPERRYHWFGIGLKPDTSTGPHPF
jgi:putative DNA primase/helicase